MRTNDSKTGDFEKVRTYIFNIKTYMMTRKRQIYACI
jgi:hypothetical protein